jgi:hypothetical protein
LLKLHDYHSNHEISGAERHDLGNLMAGNRSSTAQQFKASSIDRTGGLYPNRIPIRKVVFVLWPSTIPPRISTTGPPCGAPFGYQAARIALVTKLPMDSGVAAPLQVTFTPVGCFSGAVSCQRVGGSR